MSGNLNLARSNKPDGFAHYSETVFENDLTVEAGYSATVSGPVTIPNVTVNGNLNVMTELEITGDLEIGASGQLNVVG